MSSEEVHAPELSKKEKRASFGISVFHHKDKKSSGEDKPAPDGEALPKQTEKNAGLLSHLNPLNFGKSDKDESHKKEKKEKKEKSSKKEKKSKKEGKSKDLNTSTSSEVASVKDEPSDLSDYTTDDEKFKEQSEHPAEQEAVPATVVHEEPAVPAETAPSTAPSATIVEPVQTPASVNDTTVTQDNNAAGKDVSPVPAAEVLTDASQVPQAAASVPETQPINPALPATPQQAKQSLLANLAPKVLVNVQAIVSPIVDTLARAGSIGFAIFFAFLLGYFNFHSFWVLAVIYIFYLMDKSRMERAAAQMVYRLERERQLKRLEVETEGTREPVEWMNDIVQKAWTFGGPTIANIVSEKAKEAIQKQFSTSKPPAVTDLQINKIDLGSTAARVNYMKAIPSQTQNFYNLDVDLEYNGELAVVVTVKLGAGAVAVPIPIQVKDIDIALKAHISLKLVSKLPLVQSVHMTFSDVKADLAVQPLKVVGLLDLPLIHDWFCHTISSTLENLPIHVELIPDEEEQSDSKDAAKAKKGLLSSSASAVGSGVAAVGHGAVSVVKGGAHVVGEVASGTVHAVAGVGKVGVAAVTGVGKVGASGVKAVGGGVKAIGSGVGSGFKSVGSGVKGVFKKKKKTKKEGDSKDGEKATDSETEEEEQEEQSEPEEQPATPEQGQPQAKN